MARENEKLQLLVLTNTLDSFCAVVTLFISGLDLGSRMGSRMGIAIMCTAVAMRRTTAASPQDPGRKYWL